MYTSLFQSHWPISWGEKPWPLILTWICFLLFPRPKWPSWDFLFFFFLSMVEIALLYSQRFPHVLNFFAQGSLLTWQHSCSRHVTWSKRPGEGGWQWLVGGVCLKEESELRLLYHIPGAQIAALSQKPHFASCSHDLKKDLVKCFSKIRTLYI